MNRTAPWRGWRAVRLMALVVLTLVLANLPARSAHAGTTQNTQCSGTTNCAPIGTVSQFPINTTSTPTCSCS